MAKTKETAAPKTEKKGAAQKAEKKVPAKTDERQEQEEQTKHVEGIKKTLLSSLLGIAGGVFSVLSARLRDFDTSSSGVCPEACPASHQD